MRFDEAYKELIDNCIPISRESWIRGCLDYNKVTNEIFFDNCKTVKLWSPTHDDIIAKDWEVL